MTSFQRTSADDTRSRVLVVDDDLQTRCLLEILLQGEGLETALAENGQQALESVKSFKPQLILLDLMMPGMTGFEVVKKLKMDPDTQSIPIILVSSLEDRASRLQGLKAGAEEFLTKPIDHTDLQIRVRNLLQLKKFNEFLENHNQILETKVQERTNALRESFVESIFTLIRAAEFRDDETGDHVKRISYYSHELAKQMGLDKEFCELIFYASPMHDIGKIGIPDHILLKPGSLEPAEWAIMKSHTTIGAHILENNSSPYLKMGYAIALGHHEHWDGSGYPGGLRGETIPLPARIMQLADVYDALRSKRPYKPAFDHAKAIDIILNGDGRTLPSHFDPAVLAAFQRRADTMEEIFSGRGEHEPQNGFSL
ncbi:MAG: response regulator [Ferrovum myxofaciens]|uniref:HD domain-containing phosphohydrolase n=1 Tax=Ferrovum myxofaciens TaxID=416213 RepID=UPI0023557CEB|nr:HD domain-containing phosphohydrolase [Ferrovum myxofaciens]QKE40579.1 MAG: response regulator [Ferrovum myxofaciens]